MLMFFCIFALAGFLPSTGNIENSIIFETFKKAHEIRLNYSIRRKKQSTNSAEKQSDIPNLDLFHAVCCPSTLGVSSRVPRRRGEGEERATAGSPSVLPGIVLDANLIWLIIK